MSTIEKLENSGFAGLDHIAQEADNLGASTVPVEEGGTLGAPPPVDYATEAAGAVDMFAALVNGYCPNTEPLWSAAVRIRVSGALAPVMEKYQFTFGNLPPELTFIIVAGPVLWQTSRVVAAQMAAEKATTVKAKPEAKPEAAADPNALNPGVHDQMKLYTKS